MQPEDCTYGAWSSCSSVVLFSQITSMNGNHINIIRTAAVSRICLLYAIWSLSYRQTFMKYEISWNEKMVLSVSIHYKICKHKAKHKFPKICAPSRSKVLIYWAAAKSFLYIHWKFASIECYRWFFIRRMKNYDYEPLNVYF